MIIEIMSKEKIQEYAYSRHDEKTAVISISNHDENFPMLLDSPNNCIDVQCRVRFNDVELGIYNCITDDEAKKIVSFVNEVAGKKDKLIVQCGYGVSRSAGVAAAIMKHFAGNDMLIWGNPRYRPNIACYRKVMAAFHEAIDESELSEKVAINRSFDFSPDNKEEKPRLILLSENGEEMKI